MLLVKNTKGNKIITKKIPLWVVLNELLVFSGWNENEWKCVGKAEVVIEKIWEEDEMFYGNKEPDGILIQSTFPTFGLMLFYPTWISFSSKYKPEGFKERFPSASASFLPFSFLSAGLSLIKNRFRGVLIMGSFPTQGSPWHNSPPRIYLGHPM